MQRNSFHKMEHVSGKYGRGGTLFKHEKLTYTGDGIGCHFLFLEEKRLSLSMHVCHSYSCMYSSCKVIVISFF
jgi:hypothetical protein